MSSSLAFILIIQLIEEIEVEGRKRTYRLTAKGREAYAEELERLRACLRDAEEEEGL